MDITPQIPEGRQVIDSYGGGGFKISGVAYRGSVIVMAEETFHLSALTVPDLNLASFEPVLQRADDLDVLLVGCGEMMQLLPKALRQALRDRGIAVDTMGTGAACRTYNVLLGEERRVAAALIAVG